jgi:cupin 2 domain-containing protein
MDIRVENILHTTAGAPGSEDFLTLLENSNVKIQRIVSHSSATPPAEWYDQTHTEWVLVIRGQAILEFEGGQRVVLGAGDYLTLPPHLRHRVHETATETIWLVVHVDQRNF